MKLFKVSFKMDTEKISEHHSNPVLAKNSERAEIMIADYLKHFTNVVVSEVFSREADWSGFPAWDDG